MVENIPNQRPINLPILQQCIHKYSLPAIKAGLGLGLVLLSRKAEVSTNSIFHGSYFVDFLLGAAKIFGTVAAFHGIGQIAAA